MATERLSEVNELIQVLGQTREMALADMQSAINDLPASERLLVTVLKFLDEVKAEASQVPSERVAPLYEDAIKKIDEWARNELDRSMLRPKLLEERERTIQSIVNFLTDRSVRYSSVAVDKSDLVKKVLDDAWSDD